MAIRVAINGFGRIGRNVLRAIAESGRKDIEVVGINDLGPVETNAHLLRFDSVHGRFPGTVTVDGDSIIVFGVNHDKLTRDHLVVSNGSCTTNCLAPIAKVLNDTVGIETGFMTTIHAYTGDQPTLDTLHKDLYRGRAAAMSMIPTSTGAAKAIGLVLPELMGKLDGVAIRVPTPNVSVIDLKIVAQRKTEVKEINEAMKRASEQQMKGILGYTTAPNVSMDFNHDPHSSTFHMDQTKVQNGTLVRVMSWYDNEWGFSNRMADTAVAMGKLL